MERRTSENADNDAAASNTASNAAISSDNGSGNSNNNGNSNGTASNSDSSAPIIDVVGAAIVRNNTILCAQRGDGKTLAGYWEFPGGKIEAGETPQEALRREIKEELLCDIDVFKQICTSEQTYDFGTVRLTIFICRLVAGEPHRTEHRRMEWVASDEMPSLDWAPADAEAVRRISVMKFDY